MAEGTHRGGGSSSPRAPKGLGSWPALAVVGVDEGMADVDDQTRARTTAMVRWCSSRVKEDEGVGVAWTTSGGVEEDASIRHWMVARGTARRHWWQHGGVEQHGVEDRWAGHGVGRLSCWGPSGAL